MGMVALIVGILGVLTSTFIIIAPGEFQSKKCPNSNKDVEEMQGFGGTVEKKYYSPLSHFFLSFFLFSISEFKLEHRFKNS